MPVDTKRVFQLKCLAGLDTWMKEPPPGHPAWPHYARPFGLVPGLPERQLAGE